MAGLKELIIHILKAMKISNKYLFGAVLIVLAAFLTLGWWMGRLKADRASNSVISALNSKLKVYEYKIDSVTKIAYERQQLIIEQKQAIAQHLIDKKELKALNFKKVNEVTMLKATVKLLLDSIKPDHPVVIVPCDTVFDTQPVLYLPVEFIAPESNFYELRIEINETADMSVDLNVPVDLNIWTGWDKMKKKYKAVVTSDNPYFKVSEIKSIKVEPKKPFYNKTWFKIATLGSAFAAGVLIAK